MSARLRWSTLRFARTSKPWLLVPRRLYVAFCILSSRCAWAGLWVRRLNMFAEGSSFIYWCLSTLLAKCEILWWCYIPRSSFLSKNKQLANYKQPESELQRYFCFCIAVPCLSSFCLLPRSHSLRFTEKLQRRMWGCFYFFTHKELWGCLWAWLQLHRR